MVATAAVVAGLLFAGTAPPASAAPSAQDGPATITVKASKLTVTAPAETSLGSAELKGVAPANASIEVTGGVMLMTTRADTTGAFALEVLLRPAQDNVLKVTARWNKAIAFATVTVRQKIVAPGASVSGYVLDLERKPVLGATLQYGSSTATTNAQGRYTLTGLPKGRVGVPVRKQGSLSGLVVADLSIATPSAHEAFLQPLAAPVTVGPAGGEYTGPGWRVQIPAGAVTAPTKLNLTSLVATGPKDDFGAPMVDLSPSGLTFAKPISVILDPDVLGLKASQTSMVGVDPDTLTSWSMAAKVVDGKYVAQLTTLQGQEIRFKLFDDIWGGEDLACHPFTDPEQTAKARIYLSSVMLLGVTIRASKHAAQMWGTYLQGGTPSMARTPVAEPGVLEEFAKSPMTTVEYDEVFKQALDRAKAAPPDLTAPTNPAKLNLAAIPDVGADLMINYNNPASTPGNIAGNIGDAIMPPGTTVPDRRDIVGDLTFVPTADTTGVLKHVEVASNFTLKVGDALDFCPGDLVLEGWERHFTIPMSRLEVTPRPQGGFYARKYLWGLETKLEPRTKDVTDWYKTNDADGDTYPEKQPWPGASYPLDNCPTVANPDQTDFDGDGLGTACDPDDEPKDDLPPGSVPENPNSPDDGATVPETGPANPGAGGSYGDPHFVTFDGGSLDFHATGDYVLAESTGTDGFSVQGRYVRQPGGSNTVTMNRGVAAKVGTSVLTFGDDTTSKGMDPLVAKLDGQQLALTPGTRNLPGGVTLTVKAGSGAVVRWPDGTELAAGRWTADNAFLTLAPARWGKVRGLLGNADRNPANDTTTKAGVLVKNLTDPAQLYGVFGASWKREGSASYFTSVIPADGALPVVPPKIASLADLTPAQRTAAEKICRDKGVLPGRGLDECMLDVAITGDARFADAAAIMRGRLRNTVDLAALAGPVEDTKTIQLGERVAGSLGTRFVSDVYTIDLVAGATARITMPAACTESFVATLIAPSGRVLGRSRGPGCGALGMTKLTEAGKYTVRVTDTGGFTGAYELQVDGDGLGATCQATVVAPNDDESSPEIALPFSVNFKGETFDSIWVNNNGNVTFNWYSSQYEPEPGDEKPSAMVKAWLADVDTTGAGSSPVKYGSGSVNGRQAFCVDYDKVGYYDAHADKLNSFQLYIVDRGDVKPGAFDIVFKYRKLLWESGDLSDGVDGLGGNSASVGYSNGTGVAGTFLELPGSRTPGKLIDSSPTGLVRTSTNSDEAGVHILPIR